MFNTEIFLTSLIRNMKTLLYNNLPIMIRVLDPVNKRRRMVLIFSKEYYVILSNSYIQLQSEKKKEIYNVYPTNEFI